MDQMRAGQAMYAARCVGQSDTDVIAVIERGFRESARRRLARLEEPGLVARLEAELAAKTARLRDGSDVEERESLTALLDAARSREDAHAVRRLALDLEAIDRLETDVRLLPMRIGKARRRAAEELREARAALAGARAEAVHIANQIFAIGYFADLWEGREHMLPPGLPAIDPMSF